MISDTIASAFPDTWPIERLGNVAWVGARLGWKGLTADEYVDAGIPMLATPNIKSRDIDFAGANRITAERYEESPEIKLRDGDVLLTKDGSTIGIANVVRALPEPATVNGSIAVLRPNERLGSCFLLWLVKSSEYQALMRSWQDGMGVPHLFQSDIRRIPIPVPARAVQRAIADYLNRETAQIDAFIAKNEELIALLTERRASTITSTITSGLEASPEGSDGRWFGAIPAHWSSVPLRYLLRRIEQGVSPQTEGGLAEGAHQFGVLKSGCVNGGIYRPTEHKLLPAEFSFDRSLLVRPGDLLVNRASGSIPLLGSAAVVTESPYQLILSDKTFRLIPSVRTTSRYLYWLLNSRIYREQVESSVSGADGLANNLPQSSLRRFVLPVPPLEEQDRISSYLTKRCAQIDKSIASARRAADLARERRAALISAAVTGRIDVREAS